MTVLVQVICTLVIVCAAEALPSLDVEYPQPGNYRMVTLSCIDHFGHLLDDAKFFKRVPGQVSPVLLSDNAITFSQGEEGYFSCSSASGGGTSSEIGLAGTYHTVEVYASTVYTGIAMVHPH